MDYCIEYELQKAANKLEKLNDTISNDYTKFCKENHITNQESIPFRVDIVEAINTIDKLKTTIQPRNITKKEAENIYRLQLGYSFGQDVWLKSIEEDEIRFKRNKNSVIAYSIYKHSYSYLRILTRSKHTVDGLEVYRIQWDKLIENYIVVESVNLNLPNGIGITSATPVENILTIVNTFFIDPDWSEFITEEEN